MTHPPMTLQRFLELVAAYGSQLSRWPEVERDAAQALLNVSELARASLAEEAKLDAVLDTLVAEDLAPAFLRRLNEIPIRVAATPRARRRFQRLWAPALGWAAAAALGLALGSGISDSDDGLSDSIEAAAEQSPSDEALASLALGSFADLEETP